MKTIILDDQQTNLLIVALRDAWYEEEKQVLESEKRGISSELIGKSPWGQKEKALFDLLEAVKSQVEAK